MDRPMLQIIRGLPGSGKSTLARKFDCLHIELDMHCRRRGQYVWTRYMDIAAREWVDEIAYFTMARGVDLVVCDVMPDFTAGMARLIGYAITLGYDVYIHTCEGRFGNVHEVRESDMAAFSSLWRTDAELERNLKENFAYGRYVGSRIRFGLMSAKAEIAPWEERR